VLGSLQPVRAAPAAPTGAECARILERWAVEPKAVVKSLVDQCKAMAADGQAFAPTPAEPAVPPMDLAALDPCSSASAANNVLCWGPWAGLSPAGGGAAPTVGASELRLPDQRPELADQLTPGVDPVGPLVACAPGPPAASPRW
jgi:hypothetical protein